MKKIASKKTLLKQACMLILGCLCCSVATNWILIPNGLTATRYLRVQVYL